MDLVELLQNAPESETDEFVDYLRKNNTLVYENKYWIVIENAKYHKAKYPHHTIFCKNYAESWADFSAEELTDLKQVLEGYADWMKYENAREYKTIRRFHLHLVRDYGNWLEMMYFVLKNGIGQLDLFKKPEDI